MNVLGDRIDIRKDKFLDAKLNKSQVCEAYKKYASVYDIWSKLAESKARQRCLELANIKNGESILEVAVGTGMLFEKILQINPAGRNEGIDLTEKMLLRARKRIQKLGLSNYVLKIGDAYHLQYPDNTFDLILNNYMFDLIPEKDFVPILSEFKRVLRKDGRVILINMKRGRIGSMLSGKDFIKSGLHYWAAVEE